MSPASTADTRVGTWIERRARIAPDRVALISGSGSVTYAELAVRVRRLANGLAAVGVGRGDRVAWLGPNHPAFLESFFAVGLLGAVLAPVNHRQDPDEIDLVLVDSEPRVLIEHVSMGHVAAPPSAGHRIAVGGPIEGALDYEAFVAAASDAAVDRPVGLDDLLMLPHTSGTTGEPKGVMLSHGNVTWNVVNFLTCADFRSDDITVAIAPFFRVGGTGVNVLPVLFVGGTVVVPDETSGDAILDLMERHRVTVGFANPDLLDALLRSDRWEVADLSSIRFIVTGGAPVPERLIRAFLDRGVLLLQGYGLSEAAPLVLLLDAEHSLEKVGSAGRPPLYVDVRIVDDGRDVSPGETGELLARGPNVMAGYWRRASDTDAALTADGWLRTGDAARMDDEGFVWIVDRVSARFRVGGAYVYPGDVERVLLDHPGVADAAVVGIPSEGGGEVGVAFVVPVAGSVATADEVLALCRMRLPHHQVPATLAFVDRIPRNSVGKLLRDNLRDRAIGLRTP